MKKIFNINDIKSMNEFYQQQANRKLNFNEISGEVDAIISSIKEGKDSALLRHTNELDNNQLSQEDLKLDKNLLGKSIENVSKELLSSLNYAHDRILAYHKKLKPENLSYTDQIDVKIEQRWTPIESVGVYVPGGKAIYPSSVLMNVIPAQVAGVSRIVMVTPSMNGVLNSSILAAASICNVEEVYRIGGAQAIAALAYGTDKIDKVDMIVGPGNSYVAAAKKQVFGDVGIDMVAGPSEVMVVADADMDLEWVVEDLFAQAEHDDNAQSILVTKDIDFAKSVLERINQRLEDLDDGETLKNSWTRYGCIIICDTNEEIIKFINEQAPEHLQLCTLDARDLSEQVKNAGAIFVGKYTPEAAGDYVVGTNHVLPTMQTARFSSGLSVQTFMKRTSVVECDKSNFNEIAPSAITIAEQEGLTSHADSLRARLNRKDD